MHTFFKYTIICFPLGIFTWLQYFGCLFDHTTAIAG